MANKKKTLAAAAGGPKKKSSTGGEANGKSTNGKKSSASSGSSSGGGIPQWLCIVVGLLSLTCGVLSPHLLKAWRELENPTKTTSRKLQQQQQKAKPPKKKDPKKKKQKPLVPLDEMTQEFPCHDDALAQILSDEAIPGMHAVCMNQTMRSLQLTMYKDAQHTSTPLTAELEGLPEWIALKTMLVHFLKLSPMDDLHQPWGMYSPDGELLIKENNDEVQMDGLVQMGLVLIFQGGQFIWPGVRIGYKRTIDLYKVMPGGSPDMSHKAPRQAVLETLSLKPLVFSVEGFLDQEECDFFQKEAAPTLKYSEVTLMDMDKGRPASDFRTSQSTFLQNNPQPMIADIDYRTASLVRLPRFHQENVQVLRYGGGEKYDAHHDYFDKRLYQNDESTLKNFIQYGRRNRMITVFWYLSDVEEGGETIFPRFGGRPPPRNMSDCNIGLKVKPVRGKVIIFYSLKADGTLDPLSLHGACPVKKGVKWAANKWVWNLPIEFGSGR